MNIKDFPSLVGLMDKGVQEEIELEAKQWNERIKGTKVFDRFPLSPSQIGKCSLALARNLSHYLGLADYPRDPSNLAPRIQRVFARGHLLEEAIVTDFEKYTPLKIIDRQKEVHVLALSDEHAVRGNIDGKLVSPKGVTILFDIKSKGAYYSSGFADSIAQFFAELRETGYVEALTDNSYLVTDPSSLFNGISLDDFFVDYLLQLNAYGSAERVDFVSLYYENKNTCANYEVRWQPVKELYEYAKAKFQYIYNTVRELGAEAVPKDFTLGSSRCRLCEYNERCWGKYEPKKDAAKVVGTLPLNLETAYINATRKELDRSEEEILMWMQKEDLNFVRMSNGLVYERKYYTPKTGPYFKLRLSK